MSVEEENFIVVYCLLEISLLQDDIIKNIQHGLKSNFHIESYFVEQSFTKYTVLSITFLFSVSKMQILVYGEHRNTVLFIFSKEIY